MKEHTPDELLGLLRQWRETPATEMLDELDLDTRTLCRVSLLPEWTPELAVGLRLVRPGELPGLIDRLSGAGLLEQRTARGLSGDEPGSFWIRTRRRREVGDYLRDKLGVQRLQAEYGLFCEEVGRLRDTGLKTWLLVWGFHSDPTGSLLLDRVEGLLREKDVATAATTVATTRVVSDVIGGTLEDAVKRAQWRLDREYRKKDDLAHLSGYHRRAEIEDILEELVGGRNGQWAVHLLGNAGVGKTMTIRYLASGRLAADRGLGTFPVARVDFDHLDPRYPERRPAELLVAMADELLGFVTTRDAEHRYRAVRDAADALHEELSRSFPDPEDVGQLRLEAIARFADFVRPLPDPVVLVLDTCEELAKLYAPGAKAPAIDQTFDLLERLHDEARHVRVLFAGRRRLVLTPGDAPYGGPRLEERRYVRVVPTSGFTRADAEGYLEEREVPERTRPALLDRAAEGDRYNPFELAGLSDWVRDEPDLDLAGLAAATKDPYVERRILARVQDRQVNAALPVAVAFGEFDRELITPALTRAGVDVKAAFDGLAAQEWVNVRKLGRDGMPRVVEIDEHLRDRLRAVLERSLERPSPDLRSLGRDADRLIRQTPLSDVATETVVAAVRLLPPEEAAELWRWLDEEIALRREWGWAEQVSARVAAMEQARVGPRGPTVLAAVLATEASARVHSGHRDGLAELWSAAETYAARLPGPDSAALEARSRLGQMAAGETVRGGFPGELLDAQYVEELPDSLLSALETVGIPSSSYLSGYPVQRLLERLSRAPQTRIAAGAAIILGGIWLHGRSDRPVAGDLDSAIRRLQDTRLQEDRNLWEPPEYADWVVPRGLMERLRLIRVLIALYGGEVLSPEDHRSWSRELTVAGNDIDADRLRAALLDYELASTVDVTIPHHRPERLSGRPMSWLHNGFARPWVAAIADAWSVRGEYDRAAELLDAQRKLAVAEGHQAELIETCDLGLLRLCRQEGTLRHAPVRNLAYEGTPRLRDEAWLILRLSGSELDEWRELCSPLGRWRCDPAGKPMPGADVLQWAADHLDRWEMSVLRYAPDDFLLPSIGRLALGRARLAAGEIHVTLGSPMRARQLLESAEADLSGSGYVEGADRARVLLRPVGRTVPAQPTLRSRIADWSLDLVDGIGGALRNVGYGARRWVAGHTGRQIGFAVFVSVLFGGIGSTITGVLGGPVGWVIGVGLTVALVGLLGRIVVIDGDLRVRRLTIRFEDERLVATGYPVNGPGKLAVEPKRLRERTYLSTPIWSESYALEAGPPALTGIGALLELMMPSAIAVVLLEIPRDEQYFVPWENRIGEAMQAKDFPRVVCARWLPGPPVNVDSLAWITAGRSLHIPVGLLPDGVWGDALPGFNRLVHVVGTPVRTRAGWQFRVRDTTGDSSRVSSRGSDSREDLLDLHSLTRDAVSLVVLQAEPADGPPVPLAGARESFVRAAMAVMDNAVDAALVLPSMPDRLAKDVIEMIWRTAGRRGGLTETALFSLVADLKTMVYKAERGSGTPYACLDVLFFLRDKRKGAS